MNNIFSVAKPFLGILHFCGLFTSSFRGHPLKGSFVFSWLGALLSVLNCLILFLFISFPYDFDTSLYVISDILIKAWKILSDVDLLTYVLSLLYQLRKQSSIKQFLSLVNEFDSQVCSPSCCLIFVLKYFLGKADWNSWKLETPSICVACDLYLSICMLHCEVADVFVASTIL